MHDIFGVSCNLENNQMSRGWYHITVPKTTAQRLFGAEVAMEFKSNQGSPSRHALMICQANPMLFSSIQGLSPNGVTPRGSGIVHTVIGLRAPRISPLTGIHRRTPQRVSPHPRVGTLMEVFHTIVMPKAGTDYHHCPRAILSLSSVIG